MSDFAFQQLFELEKPDVPYTKLDSDGVSTVEIDGQRVLKVEPRVLTGLADRALRDLSHLLRPGHLAQLRAILDDPEASENDRFVALQLLKNANVAAGMILPSCQDTGTAIVIGKKGQCVWTAGSDEEALSRGIHRSFTETNLRYSQLAPLEMFKEVNTRTNLPAQIEIYSTPGDEYELMFIAKGGGSANKSFLFQQTPAVMTHDLLVDFLRDQMAMLGTAACPPYHLAVVIGGLSAEQTMKTVKLASCHYLDGLPTSGNELGRAFRDPAMEAELFEISQQLGIGAQFGGKYFCHDVRVVRLPRHGASVPIGIGVSCSADRQILARIGADGVYLEALETDPAKYLPGIDDGSLGGEVVPIDLDRPMAEILATLGAHPIKTRLSLSGTLVVARDAAHARLRERLQAGEGLPQFFKDHMIYYAGPAKTPEGYASGSFGPTTAGRMDSYVDAFMAEGGSMVSLAKGNRSREVRRACKKHGGFYLGSIGGPAAILAQDCIRKVEVLEYEELGMEAIWRIEVENFPAFIVIDDKGNDFFAR